ncbi:MAG: hypothetical protein HQL55_04940 [Magnetococcales bacterium]|nr:hypothetical protein [Magnetococcales bacterium]
MNPIIINHIGASVWLAEKVDQLNDALELYEAFGSDDALLNVLTKFFKIVAGSFAGSSIGDRWEVSEHWVGSSF